MSGHWTNVLLIVPLLFVPARATVNASDDVAVGGGAGAVHRIGVGARPLGMGGAFAAVADDAFSAYWNPAGVAELDGFEFGTMYATMSLDRTFGFANYAHGFDGGWGIAVSWTTFRVEGIEERDSTGALLREFEDVESAYCLSLAKRLESNLSLGVNVKYTTHELHEASAGGPGFDAGLKLKLGDHLTAAFVAQDMGTKLDGDFNDEFPVNLRAGSSLSLIDSRLVLAFDWEKTLEYTSKFHGGAEVWIVDSVAARAGYDDEQFTAGVSFSYSRFRIDYGFCADKLEEGHTHRFSVLFRQAAG
jgi:hypothetical protein